MSRVSESLLDVLQPWFADVFLCHHQHVAMFAHDAPDICSLVADSPSVLRVPENKVGLEWSCNNTSLMSLWDGNPDGASRIMANSTDEWSSRLEGSGACDRLPAP